MLPYLSSDVRIFKRRMFLVKIFKFRSEFIEALYSWYAGFKLS
jgi:hypothetical protein